MKKKVKNNAHRSRPKANVKNKKEEEELSFQVVFYLIFSFLAALVDKLELFVVETEQEKKYSITD